MTPALRVLVQRPHQPAERLDGTALRDAYLTEIGIERRDFYFYQYAAHRAWLRGVAEGSAASPDFGDALRAHELVDAAYRSAVGVREEAPE